METHSLKDNCQNHRKDLFGETDMKKVADKIANLNYYTLEELLFHLSWRIKNDSLRDKERGRHKLAQALYFASAHLENAKIFIRKAWRISEPFMKDKQ